MYMLHMESEGLFQAHFQGCSTSLPVSDKQTILTESDSTVINLN